MREMDKITKDRENKNQAKGKGKKEIHRSDIPDTAARKEFEKILEKEEEINKSPSSSQNSSDQLSDSLSTKSPEDATIPENNTNLAQENNEAGVTCSNKAFGKELDTGITTEKSKDESSEKERTGDIDSKELQEFPPGKLPVILMYPAGQRRRQPFFANQASQRPPNERLPPPPNYYPPRPVDRQPEPSSQLPASDNSPRNAPVAEHRYDTPHYFQMGQMAIFPDMFINAAFWAPYPTKIPPNTPACLAHLVEAEVLFIIQKVDIIELITGVSEPNMYLIQNKNGECLYYAYETSDICGQACCPHSRGFQLHILDMYQNEVIYMNRPCGCTFLFCCYPVMEVYAPPTVPVGAVTKVFHPFREEFVIIDPDENLMFRIHGGSTLKHCCPCFEFDFSIHALDSEETIVGYIRREFGGYIRTFYTNADFYGISFPLTMDVRVKAIFLGALFLLSLKRTGWVLRNVEDPETVSGHMYRMSIMTFLIPESSGVDKTRCMKLSLVHDLAECIVGDLTPFCGVDASEKHRQEEVAMKELTQMIGDSGAEIYKLYKEYEAQVTEESKFVKDLDRLDMILQAFEYEKLGDKPGKLEEFFASTINKFHFPWTIDIVKEIYKQRNLHINKHKSVRQQKF